MLVGVLLAAGLVLAWLGGSVLMRGRQFPSAAADPPARDLRLRSTDGVVLAATYRPGRHAHGPAVLLLHGVDASRGAMGATGEWLNTEGYATLAIDFRGHGGSTLRQRTFGWTEAGDARAAFDWLKRRQRGAPIGVIGISMGGAASLLGPRGPLPADALVLQAVYPDLRHAVRARIASRLGNNAAAVGEPLLSYQTWPRLAIDPAVISPIDAVGRFAGPVLVVGGREDRSTPLIQTLSLYRAAGPRASLMIVPHGDHAAIASIASPAYRHRLLTFFQATLTAPRSAPRRPSGGRSPPRP